MSVEIEEAVARFSLNISLHERRRGQSQLVMDAQALLAAYHALLAEVERLRATLKVYTDRETRELREWVDSLPTGETKHD